MNTLTTVLQSADWSALVAGRCPPTIRADYLRDRGSSEAIVTECHAKGVTCTERQARRIIGFMCYLAGERRRARYTEWERHLTDREIARFHAQLDVVMPDDTASKPGSAHALLERHALGNEAAKRQLVHTKSGSVARDCTVWVSVRPAA